MRRPAVLVVPTALVALVALVVLTAPAVLSTAPAEAEPATSSRPAARPSVKVMTQNVYLGADITRPLAAAVDPVGFQAKIVAVAHENDVVWDTVQATDFRHTRSRLIAAQIARTRPDLVGLQEVALFRTGPLELDPGSLLATDATDVSADYLKILLHRLRQAGVRYRAVQVTTEADIEAPAFQGDPFAAPSTMTDGRDIRVTDRDVILRRVGSPVTVSRRGGDHFPTALQLSLGGVPFAIPRGYGWVNASVAGRPFRFVNTHLEAYSSDAALAQALELYGDGGPLDVRRSVVFVGDINSDPLDETVHTHSTVPHSSAYDVLVAPQPGGAGLFDEWLRWRPAEEGWTSGLGEYVDDATADGFDHRIDMVLARNARGRALRPVGGTVVGTTVTDRDQATELWPSDHGGVVLRLRGLTR